MCIENNNKVFESLESPITLQLTSMQDKTTKFWSLVQLDYIQIHKLLNLDSSLCKALWNLIH